MRVEVTAEAWGGGGSPNLLHEGPMSPEDVERWIADGAVEDGVFFLVSFEDGQGHEDDAVYCAMGYSQHVPSDTPWLMRQLAREDDTGSSLRAWFRGLGRAIARRMSNGHGYIYRDVAIEKPLPQLWVDQRDARKVWPDIHIFSRGAGEVSGGEIWAVSVEGEDPLGVAYSEAEAWAKFGTIARGHLRSRGQDA